MAIIDDLNTLQSNIVTVKQVLADNINTKGVDTVTSSNTLTELANAVNDIEQGEGGGSSDFTIPEGTAFGYSSWTTMPQELVDYTKKLTVIPDYYLYEATSVNNVELNENITSIGYYAFSHCSGMTNDIVLNALEYLDSAFSYSGIKSVKITSPNAFTYSNDRQFECCGNLTSVTITSPITLLEGRMFSHCIGLTWDNITLPSTLERIGENCFEYCSGFTSITLPDTLNGITESDSEIFANCGNLTYADIGNGIVTMGRSMFRYCDKLETVVLGKNLKVINNYTFNTCKSLTTIEARCLQVPTLSGSSIFSGLPTVGVVKHLPTLDYSSWIGTYYSGTNKLLPSGWTTEEYPSTTEVIQDSYIYQDGVFYEKVTTLCDFDGYGTYVECGIETIGNELTTSTTVVSDAYICDYLNGNKCEKLEIMVHTPDGNVVGSGIYALGNVLEENCTECTVTTISYISNATNSGESSSKGSYLEFEDVPIVPTFKYQMKFNLTNGNGTSNYMFAGNLCDDVWSTKEYFCLTSYWNGMYNSYSLYVNNYVNNKQDTDLEYEWGNNYLKEISGTSVLVSSTTSNFTSSEHLNVFDARGGSEVFRIYWLKIYDGDKLLKDLIPVLDYDGVPCMLDTLNYELHYNRKEGTTFYYG